MKRLNIELKLLRLKKKIIEDKIKEYLHVNEQPGVKYGDLVVLSKERFARKKLKKQEREENAVVVLEGLGVNNAKEALKNILESMKGEKTIVESLHFENKNSKV